jgi:hypothetical protein
MEAWEVVKSGLVSDGVVKDVSEDGPSGLGKRRRYNLMLKTGLIRATRSDKQTYRPIGSLGRSGERWGDCSSFG